MPEQYELAELQSRTPQAISPRVGSVVDLGTDSSPTYAYLRAYFQILRKRLWTVLTVTFVLATGAAIISFKMLPVYEATARVAVEAEAPQIQSLSDMSRQLPTDDAFLLTQVNVLRSDNLAWRTIQQLRLGEIPEFALPAKVKKAHGVDASVAAQSRLIEVFRKHLRVELVRFSRMIEVSFESWDPQLAAKVANAMVANYAEYNFHMRYDATRQASEWMEQQLDELKAKVEKSQKAMVDYERDNAIVNISEKQTVAEQRLADLSKDLTNAQSDRMGKESLYESVRSNESQVALIAQNELLQRLEEKNADLKAQYVDALGQSGPNFPKVVRLRDQVNEIQSIIDRERKRILARARNDYQASVGREKLLSLAVAKEKADVGKLSQLLIEHNLLKREFETNQQLYADLLRRLKDATVSAGLKATNVQVVDQALVPAVAVRPKRLLNIFLGLAAGLLLGVVLAFVQEGMDNSVKTVEDIERLIGTPALAVVPAANPISPRSFWLRSGKDESPAPGGDVALVVLQNPTSAMAESYRTLRTAILLSSAPHPPQALLVTSAQPGEGKSCTCLNLALGLAQRGNPVLIIDADMRRPAIGPRLSLPQEKGLSTFLSGAHGLDMALCQVESVPNLWAIPSGPRPPNPAELLSSSSMEKLLQAMRQRFAHVVVDSPPLLWVTDATILSALVDGVVLVAESGVTARGALLRAQRILQNSGAKILGTVLNKMDLRHDGYYGYYSGSYYRGYYHSYYD